MAKKKAARKPRIDTSAIAATKQGRQIASTVAKLKALCDTDERQAYAKELQK